MYGYMIKVLIEQDKDSSWMEK